MIYYGLILYTIYYYVHSYVGVFAVHSCVLTEKKVKVPSLTWTILRHCFEIDIILMGHTVFPSVFLFFKANLPAHSLYCAESLLPATRTSPDAFLPSQMFVPTRIGRYWIRYECLSTTCFHLSLFFPILLFR